MTEEEVLVVMPPAPPPTLNIGKGDFSYLVYDNEKKMLAIAFKAISLTETWDFVRNNSGSFQMCHDNRIWVITAKIEELGYTGHSGHSFGWTMQQMRYIAINGCEAYRNLRLSA